ncbi:MAG TPA: superoxide dismutase [Candidatus Saccharimonadia bacterium]|nr:superoxide dismutase [Candidatus Saccharimonadia bacterium]
MPHTLPKLPYAYDALAPHIDAKTMEIHYTKHHQAYVDKLNDALKNAPGFENMSIDELMAHVSEVPEAVRQAVKNHGGGHYNHSMFWEIMGPGKGGAPTGAIADVITKNFGDFAKFGELWAKEAAGRFGSGWVWLTLGKDGKYTVHSTANQDNPAMEGNKPIFGLDVWEHAYYLNYQNRRPDYVTAWWNVVNWDTVNARLAKMA